MGSEIIIQRICFRNSCGIFLRDCVTINKILKVLFTYIVLI